MFKSSARTAAIFWILLSDFARLVESPTTYADCDFLVVIRRGDVRRVFMIKFSEVIAACGILLQPPPLPGWKAQPRRGTPTAILRF